MAQRLHSNSTAGTKADKRLQTAAKQLHSNGTAVAQR